MPAGKERAWTEWTETKAKIRKNAAAIINIFLLFLFLLIFGNISYYSNYSGGLAYLGLICSHAVTRYPTINKTGMKTMIADNIEFVEEGRPSLVRSFSKPATV